MEAEKEKEVSISRLASGRLPDQRRKAMAKKRKQKKGKAAKTASPKAKLQLKKKKASKSKPASRKRRGGRGGDVLETRGVEAVPLSAVKPKARTARVGGGASDYVGVSPVEGADSESPRELLEEGQTFESGIVSSVQNAPDPDRSEVRTREVPEDDVPPEYDDTDRP
jgi:hypothetical protein